MTEIKQKKLGRAGLIAMVTVLGMAAPLSTDMYMPSLPKMAAYFGVPAVMVNLTLISFFMFMAVGMLVIGAISDRSGRKKMLIWSLALYGAGSLCCVFSTSVYFMILVRIIQGLGAGGMISLSVAIIKDCFDGSTRATALATVQSMSVIAPIASPVLGAIIVQFTTWRAVFIVLTAIAVICLILALLFEESLHEDEINDGGIRDSIKRIVVVARMKSFTPFLICVSFFSAPFMAYLAVASYTYEEYFGLSVTDFSIFFAINALTSVLGPLVYMKINGRVSPKATMWILIAIAIASAVSMFTVGKQSPVLFLCTMIPFSITNSYVRPFSTNILLDQLKGDTGSASALLNFAHTMFGAAGMFAGSLPWATYIDGIALTLGACALLTIISWLIIIKSKSISMKL